ncbi:LysM peptidoglycan-binding domain-containing protein [Parathalassolituus penaei]|uniref:LysM peptidoglycan-binding domain-containing protein n=1 Tax=Parathalassolituus penaei TaxID=2997323 RepID=A0A9X3EMK0_9GAMM|nr:LysM peptidoglycan-binding domain-containing protein [Parathalassolituus penaei]MCY0965428.1 LysM peptidoglycan-binding domain-containing protein [Parathalassolituus penaei]
MRHLTLPWVIATLTLALTACTNKPVQILAEDTDEPTPTWQPHNSSDTVSLGYEWQPQPGDPEFNDVWDRVLDNFNMDLTDNDRIAEQRNFYASRSGFIERVSERSSPYIYYIAEQIEARRLPGELALLPFVESSYDPYAYSPSQAAGVWQFIPATGNVFGLRQNWWYDGRRDVRAATNAALDYLSSLSRQFNNDWYLALAAYNAGAGTVSRAIKKNEDAGKPTDYWSLDLPKETRNYVPKLLGLAQILKSPQQYGARFTPVNNQPYFAVVDTGGQIDMSQVAEMADTSLSEVQRLNPGFNRWATAPDGPHQILVPVDNQQSLEAALINLPADQRIHWNQYKVRSGDNIASIARRYQSSTDAIRTANKLASNNLKAGQILMIPGPKGGEPSNTIVAAAPKPNNSSRTSHEVASGDTLWAIASRYNVGVRDLASWNGLDTDSPLSVGQKLTVWKSAEGKSPSRAVRDELRKINYSVRGGDTLNSIANRFRLDIADIRKWNPNSAKGKYLYPGQRLTLYVNVVR